MWNILNELDRNLKSGNIAIVASCDRSRPEPHRRGVIDSGLFP